VLQEREEDPPKQDAMRGRSHRSGRQAVRTHIGARIEKARTDKDWAGARELIERELEREPDNHWLLSRLAVTYYEQFEYTRALELDERAYALAPDCPLVRWGYAGSLSMLDRPREAIAVYETIIAEGTDALATGRCGEGHARACGLFVDSLYRAALCWRALGDRERARALVEQSLAKRGKGCHSIYSDREVQKFAAQLG
jgi:tetratricopeptide (TPR) repeat protein